MAAGPEEGDIVGQSTAERIDGITTKACPGSVDDTVARLIEAIGRKRVKVFAVIDHSGEASAVGLQMPDTKLVVFGSPAAGTPLMLAAPLAALDLPLKVLVWADAAGTTRVSYNTVDYIATRYHFSADLASRLRVIDAVTDDVATDGR
jgi:uncharacterized protein (DUF302 family)